MSYLKCVFFKFASIAIGCLLSIGIGLLFFCIQTINAKWVQTAINNGIPNYIIRSLAIKGDTMYAGNDNRLLLSTDRGANWSLPNPDFKTACISNIRIQNDKVYVFSLEDAYVSSDNCSSWDTIDDGYSGTYAYDFAILNRTMFIGMVGNVFRSIDEGTNR